MPDISALNGTAIDSVAEFDGLTVTAAVAFTGLLDTYTGAAAGYSTRRLASSATNLMRIREDAGDTETDIGYDSNNELDTAAIATHCGTANGFVVTWYDQSGNSNNATQSTSGSQPQIYNGTSVITQNGKPAVTFNSDKLVKSSITNTDLCTTNAHTSVTVFNDTSSSGFKGVWGTDDRVIDFVTRLGNTNWQYSYGSSSTPELRGYTAPASDYNRQNLSTVFKGSTNGYWRLNGSQIDSGAGGTTVNTGTTNLELGESVNLGFTGNLQEVIIWPADNYNNRTGIESDINNHFAIGNLPNPTSGLLFDYPDAAAAYSVRQLANTAPLSMRVRRDTAGGTGDDDEADVLFDFTLTDPTISLDSRINNASAGVASTTLGEFLNATGYTDKDNLTVVADGFCDTWYDQSGNGNDAEQTAFGNQPQIFDSASPTDLIQENGKPAMSEWYDNEALLIASFGTTHNDVHVFSVTNDAGGTGVIGYVVSGNTGSNFRMARNFSNSDIWLYDGAQAFSTTSEATGQALISSTNETTPTAFFNGSSRSFNNTLNGNGMSGAYIGRHPSLTSGGMRGTIQEIIIFSAHQSSTNRSGIETNINDFFSIY